MVDKIMNGVSWLFHFVGNTVIGLISILTIIALLYFIAEKKWGIFGTSAYDIKRLSKKWFIIWLIGMGLGILSHMFGWLAEPNYNNM